ncbi:MAG: hypothetical protein LUC33_05050 [Prevotellaceae bacterium]|nr:hypothetical protein [Prevotellaceae bacterium]
MKLKRTAIDFDIDSHSYTLDGRELRGYTTTIGAWMYPHTYDNVPEETLRRAAERGTAIHQGVALAYQFGQLEGNPVTEVQQAIDLLKGKGLAPQEFEWLVTDGENFASACDIVTDDGSIVDIKCTSELHVPEVTLQLSVYARWLEMGNEGLRVPALYCLWLPREQYGKPRLVEITRIGGEVVGQLTLAYLNGEDSEEWRKALEPKLPAETRDIITAIAEMERQAKELTERKDKLKEALTLAFEMYGVRKYEDENITISYREGATQQRVDSARLKKDYPDVYKSVTKAVPTKACVMMRLKDKK